MSSSSTEHLAMLKRWFSLCDSAGRNQAWRAGEIGVNRSQITRYKEAIKKGRIAPLNTDTVLRIQDSIARLESQPLQEQYAKGIRRAVEEFLPALSALTEYAPDLIPISPAVGEKVGDFVGTVDRQVEKEAAKRQAAEKRKPDA